MNRKKQRQKKENLDSNRRTQNGSCLTLTLAKRKGPRSYLDLASHHHHRCAAQTAAAAACRGAVQSTGAARRWGRVRADSVKGTTAKPLDGSALAHG